MRAHLLALTLAIAAPAAAQGAAEAPARSPQFVENSYIVQFEHRSFDLSAFRAAIRARRPAADVAAIVADYERRMRLDQDAFARNVARLGGRVTAQWWIINGACVDGITADRLEELRSLPNVRKVERNAIHHPDLGVYTNGSHLATDAANGMRDQKNQLVTGKGIGIAIVDTGVNANLGGRPHAAYYPGGNPNNRTGPGIGGSNLVAVFGTSGFGTEDAHGHGTHVSGCAAANRHANVDNGPAPGASVVGVKISNNSNGSAQTSWIIAGWQLVAAQRAKHNIGVANNSYTGSPNMFEGMQQALDNTAFNADVAICVSAGNRASDTSSSQSAYNGLAVGSQDKNSGQRSSFSAIGPLAGSSRTYPHIMGGGNFTLATRLGSEFSGTTMSGTSMSSPTVAGVLALIRQAGEAQDPKFDANCARAIALNNTPGTPNRNTHGEGMVRADWAIGTVNRGDWVKGSVTQGQPVWTDTFNAVPGFKGVTVAWMRPGGNSQPPNLDLKIYDQNNRLVVHDAAAGNSYEKVVINPPAAAQWRAEVRWLNPSNATIEFCISGIGKGTPAQRPTLTAISPSTVAHRAAGTITLDGTNFVKLTKVSIGSHTPASFTVLSATKMTLTLPEPFAIGTFPVTVENTGGKSNALNLTVRGSHPSVLEGPRIAVRNGPAKYEVFTDSGWSAVLLASTSNKPSVLPGIVSLGIADNFTVGPWQLAVLAADGRGYAKLEFTVPATIPQFTVLHFEAITLDRSSVKLPLETSNVVSSTIF